MGNAIKNASLAVPVTKLISHTKRWRRPYVAKATNEGCPCSKVVTSAATKLEGPGLNPGSVES